MVVTVARFLHERVIRRAFLVVWVVVAAFAGDGGDMIEGLTSFGLAGQAQCLACGDGGFHVTVGVAVVSGGVDEYFAEPGLVVGATYTGASAEVALSA
jgi:hypothetical protein